MADLVYSTLDEIDIVDETPRHLWVEVRLSDLAPGADAPSEAFEHLARDDQFVSESDIAVYLNHQEFDWHGTRHSIVLYRLTKKG